MRLFLILFFNCIILNSFSFAMEEAETESHQPIYRPLTRKDVTQLKDTLEACHPQTQVLKIDIGHPLILAIREIRKSLPMISPPVQDLVFSYLLSPIKQPTENAAEAFRNAGHHPVLQGWRLNRDTVNQLFNWMFCNDTVVFSITFVECTVADTGVFSPSLFKIAATMMEKEENDKMREQAFEESIRDYYHWMFREKLEQLKNKKKALRKSRAGIKIKYWK